MNIHFGVDPILPPAVKSIATALQRALTTAGHSVSLAPEAPLAGAASVHWTAERPASGLWVNWHHGELSLPASTPAADSDLAHTVALGPWLAPGDAQGNLPLPGITVGSGAARDPSGPSRVAIAGASHHPDVQRAHQACERAKQAGLDLVVVPAETTPPGSWDVLVFSPSAFADHVIDLPLQAMAMGVPCILPDLPALRERAADTALFCNFDSLEELSEATVLTCHHETLRANLTTNAQRFVAHQGDQAAVRFLIETLERITPATDPIAPNTEAEARTLTAQLVVALRDTAGLYGQADAWNQAVDHLECAQRLDPESHDIRGALANARFMAGDDAGALELYDQLLEAVNDPQLHENRAFVLMAQCAFAAAAEAFSTALQARQEDPDLLNNLGVALYHNGCQDDAKQAFQQALERNPLHPDARANLAALA